MLSDIVGSGSCQKWRTTIGGTSAIHVTTAQFVIDVTLAAMAARTTVIAHATKTIRL